MRTSRGFWFLLIPLFHGCAPEPTAVETPPPKVTVARPEVRELTDYDEYNGWTAPSQVVEVRSRVRGHIVKVDFTDGEIVEAGKLLFELDPQPFEAEIGRAESQVEIARAQLEQAIKEEARQQRLFEQQAGTAQEYELSVARRKTWEAQVSSALDEVKRRQLDAEYARITAPIGGKISRALLTVGNLVNAGGGDPLLTTVVALDPIHVYFNVDERSLLRYRQRRNNSDAGQLKPLKQSEIPFEFGLETDSGFPHQGVLDFADNRIDPATGTIEVRGRAENADGRFIPGGRVRVRVAVSQPYQGILVPDVAILTDQNRKYLLCLNDQNIVLRRDVKPGRLLPDGMRVILPAGDGAQELRPEERVIVLGLQRARLNYPVEPVDEQGNVAGTDLKSTDH